MKKIIVAVIALLSFAPALFASELVTWLNQLPQGRYYGLPLVVPYIDVAAASATAYKNTTVSTATLVAAATTFTLANADYTDIITPRNIVAVISFAHGGATSTVTGTLVAYGYNNLGQYTTETLTISTNSATGSVAWRTITSYLLTITAISGASTDAAVNIGSGVKIGLPLDVLASNDIVKCIEGGALTTTFTVDSTYNSITFVNAPNGTNDYQVWLDNR